MPKFMYRVSYSAEGVQGVIKDGGSARRASIEPIVEGLGGSLESFYFALGDDDAYVVADLPSNAAAAALSLAVNASGAARVTTVPLMTPEEMDEAADATPNYTPPGG